MNTFPRIALQETDSTNRYLNQLSDEKGSVIEEYTTVTAEFQTAGKGQRGNSWESEAGKNLLFSTLLYPTFLAAKDQFTLSQIISLAIKEELDNYTSDISIKWPNDIYWKDKKICGILIENNLAEKNLARCVAGIGLNINQEKFFSDAPNPISLKQITGQEQDRDEILAGFIEHLKKDYEQLQKDTHFHVEIAKRYEAALYRRQGLYPYQDKDGRFMASVVRVEPDGRFVLCDEQGKERSYLFKEVQYLLQ